VQIRRAQLKTNVKSRVEKYTVGPLPTVEDDSEVLTRIASPITCEQQFHSEGTYLDLLINSRFSSSPVGLPSHCMRAPPLTVDLRQQLGNPKPSLQARRLVAYMYGIQSDWE
jgi:hypothetical protein